jgi:hydrogenase/urease accessory protein HupE
MAKRLAILILLPVMLLFRLGAAASAHEVRPAYLQVTEDAQHRLTLFWKQPVMGDVAVRLEPHLSGVDLDQAPAEEQAAPGFRIKRWKDVPAGPGGLVGQTLTIEGLDRTITDALVSVTLSDGRQLRQILKPEHPSLALDFAARQGLPIPAYLELGVEHILTGVDHLMFVLGLMLLVAGRWQLLRAITAFTLAHSLTLAASALGWVRVEPSIVEALVAMSIVFLAVELARSYRGQTGLTVRYPWLIAFTFGLLHGFAFAGALAEVGLPPDAIPLSLFLFNLGVEIGQLLFVTAVLAVAWMIRRVMARPLPGWTRFAAPYGIGSFAGYWMIERLVIAIVR